ncbi:unnamed protein product, partial [Owenia fusiformis]
RVTSNIGVAHSIIVPDIYKSYTRSKMASCERCKNQLNASTTSTTESDCSVFSKSCSHVPKKFSLGNLLAHLNSSGKTVSVERPDQKGFKFFMEGYIHKVCAKTRSS